MIHIRTKFELSIFSRLVDRRGYQIFTEGHMTRATPPITEFYIFTSAYKYYATERNKRRGKGNRGRRLQCLTKDLHVCSYCVRTASPVFDEGSTRLLLLRAWSEKYCYSDIYKLQYGAKTANINVKKLSSLKRGVRAINHTYKTAQIIFVKTLDRSQWRGCSYKPRLPDPISNVDWYYFFCSTAVFLTILLKMHIERVGLLWCW